MKILQGDCLEKLKELPDNSVDAVVTDPPYGLSFMGKKWDYDVPSVDVWKECLRVLKPGGYLLSFAGTRTQHKIASGIEDAGFEIRDMIAWVYGSGFPKSLNIGKAVDKLQGNERETVWADRYHDGGNRKEMGMEHHNHIVKVGATANTNYTTKGTSEWEGWGTALKPALEPITVARKPLAEKTVAENCLKWGVGGINIDECRIATDELTPRNNKNTETLLKKGFEGEAKTIEPSPLGRFPANLIHDGSDEVVELFPNSKAGKNKEQKGTGGIWNKGTNLPIGPEYGDNGSAARFFYCAKASKSERNKGCEGLEEKQTWASQELRESNSFDVFESDGRPKTLNKNNHPTVKPVALMEYLIKLVSKEGHTILDPFMGSGTTGIACKKLRREFIGVEREADYIKIAEARINSTQLTLL